MIRALSIVPTASSPRVQLDPHSGRLAFSGPSFPQDPNRFFERVHAWLNDYAIAPRQNTQVDLELVHLDTESTKHFFRIIQRLAAFDPEAHKVSALWHYTRGDEHMASIGNAYRDLSGLELHLVPRQQRP